MTTPRKPLTGIVAGGGGGNDDDWFDNTTAADDLGPLPRGTYVAVVSKFEKTTARTGTEGYCIEYKVIEGEYTGRRIWRTLFNTPAARPYTKRDLLKLGIDSAAKLSAPFPANRLVCKVTVVLRTDNDGVEKNEVKTFEVLRVQDPEADPFAPPAEGGGQ